MHWRDPLIVPPEKKILGFRFGDQKEYYYHQIFFHYVLQDGIRSHHCNDSQLQINIKEKDIFPSNGDQD